MATHEAKDCYKRSCRDCINKARIFKARADRMALPRDRWPDWVLRHLPGTGNIGGDNGSIWRSVDYVVPPSRGSSIGDTCQCAACGTRILRSESIPIRYRNYCRIHGEPLLAAETARIVERQALEALEIADRTRDLQARNVAIQQARAAQTPESDLPPVRCEGQCNGSQCAMRQGHMGPHRDRRPSGAVPNPEVQDAGSYNGAFAGSARRANEALANAGSSANDAVAKIAEVGGNVKIVEQASPGDRFELLDLDDDSPVINPQPKEEKPVDPMDRFKLIDLE